MLSRRCEKFKVPQILNILYDLRTNKTNILNYFLYNNIFFSHKLKANYTKLDYRTIIMNLIMETKKNIIF